MFTYRTFGAACLLLTASLAAHGAEIKGAGSSAAQPLYASLAQAYAKAQQVTLAYQPSGSSDGLAQIKGKSVDFGATDIALDAEQRKAAGLVCVPTAISGVVPVVNLPGLKKSQLQLTGDVLADIFARKIVRWNDDRLRALNRGLALPDLAISVIVRADGSGTTYNFSDYLGKANASWKSAYGRGYQIAWPDGVTQVKGSSGVVAALKQASGAIAYIDYQYAVLNNLTAAGLKNHDGQLVQAGPAGFSAALINSAWLSKGKYEEMLTDRPGAASWPITSGTFILIPQVSAHPERTVAALKFFTWGFMHGDDVVGKADFVRLPEIVQGRIFAELTTVTGPGGAPLAWSMADALK